MNKKKSNRPANRVMFFVMGIDYKNAVLGALRELTEEEAAREACKLSYCYGAAEVRYYYGAGCYSVRYISATFPKPDLKVSGLKIN